ncbi:MAG: hypothetical protein EOP84_02720 [Verrucomicrobiaceae bacterium]|nr:MAG: hypothetical protein EOP84_02720 [Verrucomicrobiaceae bacterium]
MKLIDHVRGQSSLIKYRQGVLWYETDTGFVFPIPVNDLGTAEMKPVEKSSLLMRWVRIQFESDANGGEMGEFSQDGEKTSPTVLANAAETV